MSSLDNFSISSKLDIKTDRLNPTEAKFATVKRKIRKQKAIQVFIYFISKRLTVALATKYKLK